MPDKELGAELSPEEQAKAVSEGEQAEVVSKEKAEVSAVPETDVAKLKGEAIKEFLASDEFKRAVQSEKDKSIHKELKPYKDKVAELEKKRGEEDLARQEAKEIEELGDTKEVKDWQAQRRELKKLESTLQSSLAQHEGELKELYAYRLHKKTGIEMEKLLECDSPEAMSELTQKLVEETTKAKVADLEEKLRAKDAEEAKRQKVDSGLSSGAGASLPDDPMALFRMAKTKTKSK